MCMMKIGTNIWNEEEEQFILFPFVYCAQQVANENIS